jgi:uncharacterized protein
LGAILPVCECAVVPVIRRLVKKGLPVSCAVTYMLAAPVINPITLFSTHKAFANDALLAWYMPFSRLGVAFIATVLVGWFVTKLRMSSVLRPEVGRGLPGYDDDGRVPEVPSVSAGSEAETAPVARGVSFDSRILHATRSAKHDLLDTAMYFIIGAVITALFNTKIFIRPEIQDGLMTVSGNDWLAVPAMMVLAALLSLCSTTDAFIAANLTSFSWVAKLGFLTFGPMVDLKLIFLYSTVFKKRFVTYLVMALFVLICALCLFWKATSVNSFPAPISHGA